MLIVEVYETCFNLVWTKTKVDVCCVNMAQPDNKNVLIVYHLTTVLWNGGLLNMSLQKGIFCILQKAIFPSQSLSLARLYVHSCRRFVGGVVVDSSRSIVCSLLQKYLFKQKCFHIIYHGQMRTEQIYLLHHGTIYDSRLWRGPLLCVAMFITRKGKVACMRDALCTL